MANEYKLSYTGAEINEKLGEIDNLSREIGDLSWSDLGEKQGFGDTLTWDGNTDGISEEELALGMVLISTATPTLEELAVGCTLLCGDATFELTGTQVDSDLITLNADTTNLGIVVNVDGFDMGEGLILPSKGIYIIPVAGEGVTYSLTINNYNGFPTTVTEKVPNKYLDILETVGSDTLTWDGNTEGKFTFDVSNIESSLPIGAALGVKISDHVPTIEELDEGVTIVFNEGNPSALETATVSTFLPYEGVEGLYANGDLIAEDGSASTLVMAVLMNDMDAPIGVIEKGIYFMKLDLAKMIGTSLEGETLLYPTSVTFNGYTFKKEVIKEEYLPPMEGMTVKSKTFTDMKMLREWIVENQAKLLRVSFDMGNNIINFYNVTIVSNDSGVNFVSLDKLSVGGLSNLVSAVNEMEVRFYETNLTIFSNQTSIKEDGTCTFRNDTDQTIPYEYVPSTGITATVLYFD